MSTIRLPTSVRRITCAIVSLAVFGSGIALADSTSFARLTQIQGTVLVDRGAGFVPVSEATGLKLGDRVMVADKGGALLDFGKDCAVPLASPSMTVVAKTACTTTTQNGPRGVGPIVGALGVAGVGGLIIYAIVNDDDDDDDGEQVSP